MRTVKRNPFLSGVCAIVGGAFLTVGAAGADVTSDRAAGFVVMPKLIFDSLGIYTLTELPTDTEVQLTNVSDQAINVRCFYVNANSHCTNDPERVCFNNDDCEASGAFCTPGWIETDFEFRLTPRQPIIWLISDGLDSLPLGNPDNFGSIPRVTEDPFFGELKCFQVDENGAPVDRNDLKGEVTIVGARPSRSFGSEATTAGMIVPGPPAIDARTYNAIGIQAVEGANDGDNTLILGGDDPEYNGCPSVVILDHFFDDAVEPIDGDFVKTHLTVVPCSQDFLRQDTFDTTLQFLVFNEFEQRISASRTLNCWQEFELCHLDHNRSPARGIFDNNPASGNCQRSVFSAFVQGTLTGQTRIRAVEDEDEDHGHGVIAVAEEFYRTAPSLGSVHASTAFNTHQIGTRPKADIVSVPP